MNIPSPKLVEAIQTIDDADSVNVFLDTFSKKMMNDKHFEWDPYNNRASSMLVDTVRKFWLS